MSIKILIKGVFAFSLTFLFGCKESKESNLASSYHKLSLLELEDCENNDQAVKKSLCYLDEAINLDSKGEYLALKATILFRLQKLKEADLFFEKALDSNLSSKLRSEVFNNYACLLAQLGDEEKALKIWKILTQSKDYLTPEVALFNQAKLFLSQKDYFHAKKKLFKAIKLSPNYLDAHFYLAMIAGCFLKDRELAKRELALVLTLDPNHAGVRELMKLLGYSSIV